MPAPSHLYTGGAGYTGRRAADAALAASAREATAADKVPAFQRHHYEVIAAALREARRDGDFELEPGADRVATIICRHLAAALERDDRGFRRETFFKAAGVL